MLKRILAIFAVFFLLTPATLLAQDNSARNQQMQVLPRSEVVNGDYFAGSELVEISGTVNGDVYAVGGQVLVDGIINGDLLVAGGTITISGDIAGDVRAAGGQIVFTGNVTENVSVFAGNVEFTDASVIGGNLVAGAGSIIINSPIGGDINAGVGSLRLGSSATVAGNINYTSEDELSVAETASVSGQVNRVTTPSVKAPDKAAIAGFLGGLDLFAKLSSLITTLVIGLLMLRFLPNYTQNAANKVTTKFMPSLAFGFLSLIAVPLVAVILFATVLGIPLALLLGIVFLLYLYVVRIFAMVAIGHKISSMAGFGKNSYIIFVIGVLVYYLLTLIPVIGWIIKLLVLTASFGAALTNERDTWRQAKKAKVV